MKRFRLPARLVMTRSRWRAVDTLCLKALPMDPRSNARTGSSRDSRRAPSRVAIRLTDQSADLLSQGQHDLARDGQTPLLGRGGVAARSRRNCEAADFAQTGW